MAARLCPGLSKDAAVKILAILAFATSLALVGAADAEVRGDAATEPKVFALDDLNPDDAWRWSNTGGPIGLFMATGSVDYEADEGAADPASVAALVSSVPEPATWALMIAGFSLAGIVIRNRKHLTALGR